MPRSPSPHLHRFHSSVGWNVPVGGRIHKFNFLHTFQDGCCQMNMDGLGTTVWKHNKGLKNVFKVRQLESNPCKKSFQFGSLKIDVWVSGIGDDFVYALDVSWPRNSKVGFLVHKEKMEVWGNGQKLEEAIMNFTDSGGSRTTFLLETTKCKIETKVNVETGTTYEFTKNGEIVPLDVNLDEPIHRRPDLLKKHLQKN
ncbi:hypothetical protein CAEBREN_11877 [Caenorhabditis brenneri]|uniref:Uncharacterized protein n=1 Tax=Caenorhabditis brenneri TaxID=135651 RepID=G0MWN5_CAEBE|nr:hypothetical protein CAEBREN_11877 [Caenorhabditis brenneri]